MSRPAQPARNDFAWFHPVTTRWSDNDIYGHVNNTVYYQWFDTAVNSWLIAQGLLDIDGGDPIALVVETRCTFHEALSFPEQVEIGLSVQHLGRSSVRYAIGVFGAGRDLAAAAGEFVHVAVDRSSRRPVEWPMSWKDGLSRLIRCSKV